MIILTNGTVLLPFDQALALFCVASLCVGIVLAGVCHNLIAAFHAWMARPRTVKMARGPDGKFQEKAA